MRLLNKAIRSYLLFSILLVCVFIPLFYLSIEFLFLREMDRVLTAHKEDFYSALPYIRTSEDRHFFQLVNKEFVIEDATPSLRADSLYSELAPDPRTGIIGEYRTLRTPVEIDGMRYDLVVRESLVPGASLMAAITIILVVLLAALTIGLVFINRYLSKRIWIPFYEIMRRLRDYRIGVDPVPAFPYPPAAELRELTKTIGQLILKSREAYLNQKEFTENASHELQTPLAICRTKLELLAQTRELTQEQAELVEALLANTDRMSRLSKNLLLLSKIENRQFIERKPVNLHQILDTALDNFERHRGEKQIRLRKSYSDNPLITGNPDLVEVMVGNLVSNATRYCSDGGEVNIVHKGNTLSISNSGDEISNPEKVFYRFHRESRSTPGSGLGLSIAKKIAEVSGYQLDYEYRERQHIFSLTF